MAGVFWCYWGIMCWGVDEYRQFALAGWYLRSVRLFVYTRQSLSNMVRLHRCEYRKNSNNRTVCYVVGVASSGKVWYFFVFLCLSEGLSTSFSLCFSPLF